MSTSRQLKQLVREHRPAVGDRNRRNQEISDNVFATSPYLSDEDFRSIHPDDILLLFELYDEAYFERLLSRTLAPRSISFRLSRRMTSAGGKTTRWSHPQTGQALRYEIAISSTLLFQSFNDPERRITVTGLECHTRLQALMRVMEHELVHLSEMLVWQDSSCSQFRFQDIASRMFGHTDHQHDLMTPVEAASTQYGIRPGIRVRFDYEGRKLEGVVNRITKRATVLVAHPQGQPYSDGQRYIKYYIPPQKLEAVAGLDGR